ncbi:MAG: thiol:disulfide interchange protein DsbC [Candidatus Azotimanducaceae bacterium]|jgi:thiol:disulfide interchange protein DsbC
MTIFKSFSRFTLFVLFVSTFSSAVMAAEDKAAELIRERLLAARPDIPILDIQPAQIPGFYDVYLPAGQVLHFTADGKHFYTGDLYGVTDQLVNLTESSRSVQRKKVVDSIDESEMVVFSPPQGRVKATITVFTDIDCVFCRKLHDEVPELNRLGIAVRYLAYPRSGPNTPSYDKLVSAWCAENPKMALTRAKAGQDIPPASCENPVTAQYELGGRLGINSTPSMIYEDGTLARGYMPAAELADALGIL